MKRFLGLLVLCASVMAMPVYAGTWIQDEESTWYYFNEDGSMLTGWLNDTDYGKWYYLDTQTGVWNSKPAINEVSACHLLENALKAAGLYQNEDAELVFLVDEVNDHEIQISVAKETAPDSYERINSYTVNKKSGIAKTTVGDNLYLYQ